MRDESRISRSRQEGSRLGSPAVARAAVETFADVSPVFVVGVGRSGTTLLQLLLNAHPNISIYSEIHFFDQILELRSQIPDISEPADLDRLIAALWAADSVQYLPDFAEHVAWARERILADGPRTYTRFYRLLLESSAHKKGARRFGEKTPGNVRYIRNILELFPRAKIIHIVRDARDVVSSLVRMPWWPNDALSNSVKWRLDVEEGMRFRAYSENYTEVRYEDLVDAPEQVLRRLCAFIGEPYDARMLEFHDTAEAEVIREPWKDGTRNPINRKTIGAWRQRLPQARVAIVETVAGRTMRRFGYEPSMGAGVRTLLAAAYAPVEFARWVRYRREVARARRAEAGTRIHGEMRTVVRMFLSRVGLGSV